MKLGSLFILVITFQFYSLSILAQTTYEEWMETGKYEYSKTIPYNDLDAAIKAFKKAIELKPQSSEAWYRLALTYQKMYCNDFQDIENYKKHHAQAITNILKKTIELSKKHEELKNPIQEPDEMYTNAWGRLALAYFIYNQIDSMKWALNEMSKSFFYEPILELTQNLLNEVEQNSILFVNSENIYYYLLYNQYIKNYRKDVKIIYFEGLNAVWYDVWLQNIYFPFLTISKDEIEEKQQTAIYENQLIFTHYQQKSKLAFPFAAHITIDRANWFFYQILQKNGFEASVYAVSSFDNDISRVMKNHWHIIGLTKMLFFEVPDNIYDFLFQNANSWKFNVLKSLNGDIPEHLLKKLQFYRFPFILYAYNNINTNNELVKRLIEVSENILPENLLPMQKDVKEFFLQIKQVTK